LTVVSRIPSLVCRSGKGKRANNVLKYRRLKELRKKASGNEERKKNH